MSEIIFEVTGDEADGGFTASALGHSIVTKADSRTLLRASVRRPCSATLTRDILPPCIRLHRVMDELIAVA